MKAYIYTILFLHLGSLCGMGIDSAKTIMQLTQDAQELQRNPSEENRLKVASLEAAIRWNLRELDNIKCLREELLKQKESKSHSPFWFLLQQQSLDVDHVTPGIITALKNKIDLAFSGGISHTQVQAFVQRDIDKELSGIENPNSYAAFQ